MAYQEFLRANGINPEDLSQKEYSDLLNTQDMYNDDLIHFSKSENCKDVGTCLKLLPELGQLDPLWKLRRSGWVDEGGIHRMLLRAQAHLSSPSREALVLKSAAEGMAFEAGHLLSSAIQDHLGEGCRGRKDLNPTLAKSPV